MRRYIVLALLLTSGAAFADDIRAVSVADEAAYQDPVAAAWQRAPEANVTMSPQVITQPSLAQVTVPEIKVRAIHNNKWIAVRLDWADATQDMQVDTDKTTDACAIQFPTGPADKTSPFMGAKGAPVEIIHWKGIWQNDVSGKYQDVQDLHPNMWVDFYAFATGKRPYPVTSSFTSENAKNTLGAIYVQNPMSQLHRKTPVEELMAEGYGTLTTQPEQNAKGNGVWKEGRWYVVLSRPLKTGDKWDPILKIGDSTVIAFAIWDGAKGNVGARKNYAAWTPLTLEK